MREMSIEVSGKTEDEAIQNALQQIGLDRDEVSVVVVRRAKSGLLGIGGTTALVKVTYTTDEPEPVAVPAPAPVTVVETPPPAAPATPVSIPRAEFTEGDMAGRANQFLIGLMERMGTAATPEIREEDGTIYIELKGSNMGSLIGRRGETLDAIQHLTNYAVNRGADKRTRIYIDAENYRKKREETLLRLAHKVAEKVVRYRKNMGLEPMNAYERHVIHTALQETPNVTTYSSGTEPNRRVFVAYDRTKRPTNPPSGNRGTDAGDSVPVSTPSKSTHREWA